MAALPAVLRAPLAAMWARACHGEHAHLEWLYDQMTPLACEEERLQDWATLYGVERLGATAAGGQVAVTGSAGATLLKDALLRGPNGLDYSVTAALTLSAAQASADVVCAGPGAAGNLPDGAQLTLVDPLPGLAGTLTVGSAGLAGGADVESLEAWRARVVDEWQTLTTQGSRGGRRVDYVYWARSAHPSVTGALAQAHALGLGSMVVRPICNGLPGRLPPAAVLAAVRAYLADAAPGAADVYVLAPVTRAVAIALDLSAAVDSQQTRTAIETALRKAVLSEQTDGAVLTLAEVDAAVSTVTTQYTRLAPTFDIACGAGEVLALPSVTWA